MVYLEYIGGTQLFSEIENGLNSLMQEPLAMILGALIIGGAIFALARRY